MTTCALLASPMAEGMFSSAFIQSVGCTWLSQPLDETGIWAETAEDQGVRIAAEMECDDLDCMRQASVDQVVAAGYLEPGYGPIVDGVIVPTALGEAFYLGEFSRVPVVAGVTANEGPTFTYGFGVDTESDLQENLLLWAGAYGIDDTETLAAFYSSAVYGSPKLAFDQFYADLMFVCPTKFSLDWISYHVPAYAYYYSHVPSWLEYYPELSDFGAYHSSELPLVFGSGLENLPDEEQTFSEQLMTVWSDFANGQAAIPGLGEWPEFSTNFSSYEDGGKWVDMNASGFSLLEGPRREQCDFISEQWWGE